MKQLQIYIVLYICLFTKTSFHDTQHIVTRSKIPWKNSAKIFAKHSTHCLLTFKKSPENATNVLENV